MPVNTPAPRPSWAHHPHGLPRAFKLEKQIMYAFQSQATSTSRKEGDECIASLLSNVPVV